MQATRRSDFIDNANLIRLTDERGSQLLELGRQMNSLVNAMKERLPMDTNKKNKENHVSDAGR